MSDSTGLSSNYVVNQFCSLQDLDADLTPKQFFANNSIANVRRFAPEVIAADIRNRLKNNKAIDVESYFEHFPEIQTIDHAWAILHTAEPWLIENEGPNWKQRWMQRFPITQTTDHPSAILKNDSHEPERVPDDLQSGSRILHFEIEKLIGKGTYGVVYLASNVKLARDVALKVSPQGGNEGRALARLNHTNVVRVYGQHEVGSKRILEMEYVNGSSLDRWILSNQNTNVQEESKRSGVGGFKEWAANSGTADGSLEPQNASVIPESIRNSTQTAVWITLQLANGLAHAHQRGILHQDIKPANVLVDRQGKPLLTDFNVAFIDGQSLSESIGGTVNYMSPEHLRAFCSGDRDLVKSVDMRSDIYSLGVVLLELLGGNKLWGKSISCAPQAIAGELLGLRQDSAPEEVALLHGVDHTLAAIVEKALQPNASDRYQSASDLATDLSNWLDGLSNVYADNPSLPEQAFRFVRRKKLAAGAFLFAGIAFVASLFALSIAENSRLQRCEELLSDVESSLAEGRGAYAAEKLGMAKTQLDQLWILPWGYSQRLKNIRETAMHCSQDVKEFESVRFSSLFGQASLLSVHQTDPQDIQILVKESLDSYGVMANPDWESRPPFSELSTEKQLRVAENITELMLVSMLHSKKTSNPDADQWSNVIERLPEAHRDFKIFQEIQSSKPSKSLSSSINSKQIDCFEMYLNGVWSTCERDAEKAMAWYTAALQNQPAETREKFWLRYRAGLSAQRLGMHQKAIAHYNVCLGMKPDLAWIPFNLALIHAETGEIENAKKSLLRTIHLDSKMSAAYQALASLYIEAGEPDEAITICNRAKSAGVSSPELTRLEETASSIKQIANRRSN